MNDDVKTAILALVEFADSHAEDVYGDEDDAIEYDDDGEMLEQKRYIYKCVNQVKAYVKKTK